MECTWTKYLPFILGFLLFVSCKDQPKTPETNPIFNSEPALKQMTGYITNSPKDATLYYSRGKMLLKLKQDSLALKDFMMAASLDSNNASYYSTIGDLMFENKDITGSLEWLQKAIAKNPLDPKAHIKIAKLFLYMKEHGKAIEEINIVMRKDVYDPEAYFLKGMVYKDLKDTAKAISNFQSALQVAPDYQPAVVQLGLIYSAKNDPIAIKYLDNASRMDSSDAFPIFARGVYYQNRKQYVEAKEEYKKCIIRNKRYVDAYFNLGYIFMQQDSIEKSLHFYDLAVSVQPDNPTAYYDRGVCYEMLKKLKEAAADYRRASVLDTAYQSPKDAMRRLGIKN